MNPRRTLQATFWAMIVLQTIGSIDLPKAPSTGSPLGGQGTRKMPAPRAYVAVVVLWSLLNLIAEGGYGRAAARLSALVLLTGAVLGPFGQRAVSLLNATAKRFAVTPPASSSTSSPAATPTEVLV